MTWITHKGSPPRLPVVAFAGRIRIRGLAHSGQAGPVASGRRGLCSPHGRKTTAEPAYG